eukprot:Skav204997  [mRNA]  locus=scaffold3521:8794:13511:+ [translate_table: standard]
MSLRFANGLRTGAVHESLRHARQCETRSERTTFDAIGSLPDGQGSCMLCIEELGNAIGRGVSLFSPRAGVHNNFLLWHHGWWKILEILEAILRPAHSLASNFVKSAGNDDHT